MSTPTVSVLSPGLPPPPGGLQQFALDVHLGLHALTTTRMVGVSTQPVNAPDVETIAAGRTAPVRLAAASVRHVVRHKPDVVQAITWKVAAPVVALRGHGLAVHAVGAELVRPGPALRRVRDAVLRRADLVVAISNYTASLVADMTKAPVRVITPGIRLPAETSERKRAGGVMHVVSVGALVPRKGHDRLIRAVRRARDAGAQLRLTIVGDGPERATLAALITSLGVADCVRLAGRLSDDEVDATYRDADAFALLGQAVGNEFEGFGIVLLEAASYGLPVVTTATGGTIDAVRPGVNALMVNDADDAAEALITLCNDEATADRLAAEGLVFAAASTVDAKAAELLAAYGALFS